MADYESTFGMRLRELRERAGYGLREFCRETDVTHAFLSRVEVGAVKAYPSIERIVDWSELLDLEYNELEELVARRMAERYGCGNRWSHWRSAAHHVISGRKGAK